MVIQCGARITLVLIASLLLASCGDGENKKDGANKPAAATPAAEQREVAAKKETLGAQSSVIVDDTDSDGVANKDDRCADTTRGLVVDQYGCVQQPDSDGDGVADTRDNCADTPAGLSVDGVGCLRMSEPEIFKLNVNFASGSAEVDSEETVQALASVLRTARDYPAAEIMVFGYTDSSGDASANQRLSAERAAAVAKVLADAMDEEDRLVASKGMGSANPVASNDTAAGRRTNRRIEVELSPP